MIPKAHASGSAKVIDAEFAHFGCAAFDVGTFIAHLLFAALACINVDETRSALVAAATTCWEQYTRDAATPLLLLQRTAGFAGCEIIRRVIGAAHVDDLERIS